MAQVATIIDYLDAHAGAFTALLTAVLVVVTAYYAWQNRRMAIEMGKTRALSILPKLTVEFVHVGPAVMEVAVKNVGPGPALAVDVELIFEPADETSQSDKRRYRQNVLVPANSRCSDHPASGGSSTRTATRVGRPRTPCATGRLSGGWRTTMSAEVRAERLGAAVMLFGLVDQPPSEALEAASEQELLTPEEWDAWRASDDEDYALAWSVIAAERERRAAQWSALDLLLQALTAPGAASSRATTRATPTASARCAAAAPPPTVTLPRDHVITVAQLALGWHFPIPEEGS